MADSSRTPVALWSALPRPRNSRTGCYATDSQWIPAPMITYGG